MDNEGILEEEALERSLKGIARGPMEWILAGVHEGILKETTEGWNF